MHQTVQGTGLLCYIYAHVGMLFTRFPNPVIREFVHRMVDMGADCVVTAHPHCLGGYEHYDNKIIIYSLGDFLMDGASFRRRRAGVLKLDVENGDIKNWSIQPVETTDSKRFGAVSGMAKRVFTDRSKMSYDADAVSEKNTSLKDIR